MLAETAKLAIELNLTGNAKQNIAGVDKSLVGLSRRSTQIGQGFKTMGAGVGVAFRNLALIAIPIIGGLTAGLIKSVKEGQEAAKVQTIYANAIQNSGKVSTQYVKILNDQQKALMNLAGIDDELIKSSQTRLIQMGLTGEQVAKVTPLVLDFAKATGLDLETATKLTGKSIMGNIGALSRYGVQVDKTKAKVDPFAATVDALNGKFAGTTKALSGSLEARLGALREGLANVREEAGIKLLPALTKIVDVAGRKLVPAFSKFIDRVLPDIIAGLDKFVDILENGGAERAIKGITDALGPMVQLLKIAAAPVRAIVEAFLKLPANVQGALIAGVAINKLSGGLLAQGGGQVAGGIGSIIGPSLGAALGPIFGKLGLSRGASPANPLYVSDVLGGGGAGSGILAGGKWAMVGKLIGGAFAVVAAAEIADLIHSAISPEGGLEGRINADKLLPADQLSWPWGPKNTPKWIIDSPFGPINVLGGDSGIVPGGSLTGNLGRGPMPRRDVAPSQDALRAGVLARALAAGLKPTADQIQRTLENNNEHIAELIYANTVVKREDRQDRKDRDNAPDAFKTSAIAAIEARAIAKGLHPSLTQLQRTFENNTEHLRELVYANTTGMQDVRSAVKETTGAVRDLPVALRNALGGLLHNPNAPDRPGKDDAVPIHIPSKPHRAGGGPVKAGLMYLVGENGPEWFSPDRGGQILPNGKRIPYDPDAFSQSLQGIALQRNAASARARLLNLHSRAVGPDERGHATLSGLVGRRDLRDPRFLDSAVLDPSQITDIRGSSNLLRRMREYRYFHRDQSRNGDAGALTVKVTSSAQDTADKTTVRRRWGTSAVGAGGG